MFVDFIGAQIKTLAFLAYIIRVYQEQVSNHAGQMVKGIIGLLTLCPPEVAHSRKELIVATRHILATDLRISMSRFIYKSIPINIHYYLFLNVITSQESQFPRVGLQHPQFGVC